MSGAMLTLQGFKDEIGTHLSPACLIEQSKFWRFREQVIVPKDPSREGVTVTLLAVIINFENARPGIAPDTVEQACRIMAETHTCVHLLGSTEANRIYYGNPTKSTLSLVPKVVPAGTYGFAVLVEEYKPVPSVEQRAAALAGIQAASVPAAADAVAAAHAMLSTDGVRERVAQVQGALDALRQQPPPSDIRAHMVAKAAGAVVEEPEPAPAAPKDLIVALKELLPGGPSSERMGLVMDIVQYGADMILPVTVKDQRERMATKLEPKLVTRGTPSEPATASGLAPAKGRATAARPKKGGGGKAAAKPVLEADEQIVMDDEEGEEATPPPAAVPAKKKKPAPGKGKKRPEVDEETPPPPKAAVAPAKKAAAAKKAPVKKATPVPEEDDAPAEEDDTAPAPPKKKRNGAAAILQKQIATLADRHDRLEGTVEELKNITSGLSKILGHLVEKTV